MQRLQLRLALAEGLPPLLYGDRTRLRQVLINLLDNALKFTNRGRIEVVGLVLPDEPEVARIEVRDTGIGISSEARQRIFEPFVQADASTHRRYGGTGLGLAICRGLIESMAGSMALESEAGLGTTVILKLPLRIATEAPEPRPFPAAEGSALLVERHVLIVEDNPINQVVLKAQLESLGAVVEMAENGVVALRTLSDKTFDLILMDCQMPEMDGYETTRRIRQKETVEASQRVPIVALTASAIREELEAAVAAGMDDVLTKPYTLDALVERLARHLGTAPAHPT